MSTIDLEARQMRRQRAAIGAPLARAFSLRGRRLRLDLRRRLRFALLDVFEGEQQLIGRQRLGAAAEAVALQFLDDLDEPLRANPLGDQHRLQRFSIVGKRIGRLQHAGDETIFSAALRRFSST